QPRDQQNWKPLEELLNGAEKSVQREILRAKLLVAQEKPEEAKTTLENAQKKYKGATEPWIWLAELQLQQARDKAEGSAQALKTLSEAEKTFGDRFQIRLARADFLRARANLIRITQAAETKTKSQNAVQLATEVCITGVVLGQAATEIEQLARG